MAMENFKEFVKKHKKEIIIGTVAAVAGAVVGALLKENIIIPRSVIKTLGDFDESRYKVLTPYKSAYGDCTDVWISGTTGNPTAIIRDINWQFMGDVGGEFVDYCLDNGITVTMDQPINVFMEIVNN